MPLFLKSSSISNCALILVGTSFETGNAKILEFTVINSTIQWSLYGRYLTSHYLSCVFQLCLPLTAAAISSCVSGPENYLSVMYPLPLIASLNISSTISSVKGSCFNLTYSFISCTEQRSSNDKSITSQSLRMQSIGISSG
jgi:hypothetical protein